MIADGHISSHAVAIRKLEETDPGKYDWELKHKLENFRSRQAFSGDILLESNMIQSVSLIENLCKWQIFNIFVRGNNWLYVFFFDMDFGVCCGGFAPFFLKLPDLSVIQSSGWYSGSRTDQPRKAIFARANKADGTAASQLSRHVCLLFLRCA